MTSRGIQARGSLESGELPVTGDTQAGHPSALRGDLGQNVWTESPVGSLPAPVAADPVKAGWGSRRRRGELGMSPGALRPHGAHRASPHAPRPPGARASAPCLPQTLRAVLWEMTTGWTSTPSLSRGHTEPDV